MASPFDVLNRVTFTLERISSPTSGHFNSSDVWVAPDLGSSPVTVQGHLSMVDRMNRESQWGDSQAGVIEKGMLRFFTETLLQEGDIIVAAQGGGTTIRYRVMGMVRAQTLMARFLGTPVRYEWDMREVPR